MDYQLIQRRAELLYEEINMRVNDSYAHLPYEFLDGLKATFALSRKSIRLYLNTFYSQGTEFDLRNVESCYEEFSDSIPGPKGLTKFERNLLIELQDKTGGQDADIIPF